jgi:acyl-coenzyme A thioesterase PaaI-like protein
MSGRTKRRNFWDVPADPGGAWAAKRRLAAELRTLVERCVTTDAPEDVLDDATEAVREINDLLGRHPRRTFQQQYVAGTEGVDLAVFADRGTLVGLCNPFAPPMRLHAEGDLAVGRVTFNAPYEGAPGFVHGGIVAAAFDQLFGWLQVGRGVPSLTGRLAIRYLRPTPTNVELRYEGRVDRSEGRKHHVTARVLADGAVTSEADAIFVELDETRMRDVLLSVGRCEPSRPPRQAEPGGAPPSVPPREV